MKFARYLEDTQTPEWKRAYIDYRLLKKRITAIQRASGVPRLEDSPVLDQDSGDEQPTTIPEPHQNLYQTVSLSNDGLVSPAHSHHWQTCSSPFPDQSSITSRISLHRAQTLPISIPASAHLSSAQPPLRGRAPSFARLFSSKKSSKSFMRLRPQPPHPYSELPLRELIPLLSPLERAFFSTLDAEVEKIESFYVAREEEMKHRTDLLEKQLEELGEHKKSYYAAYPTGASWNSNLASAGGLIKSMLPGEGLVGSAKDKGKAALRKTIGINGASSSAPKLGSQQGIVHLDPDEYYTAKHKLKKAVLEHYRGLQTLQNYRIMNITGIRKALKKFQKVTKIAAQNTYMTEKVDTSAFASEDGIKEMMDKMEDLYAMRFAHGDKKKATERLRSGAQWHKSHHLSIFWSGLFIGLAIPALFSGFIHSYQQSTRDAIPGWDALLLVYGVFLIPVLFSVLVGLNISIWADARINYVFIFQLDPRSRLDHREYFALPSLLLGGLCYAFWLSFARIGISAGIGPTIWPLVWLGSTAILLLDPFPFLFVSSRYWLLRNVGKLLTSGTRPVEFADFWLGDQFCSLVFPLSSLYLVVCVYVEGFNSNWRQCGSTSQFWPLSFVIAMLPYFVRLVQSIKRYADSGLGSHLVNGGKYAAGIVAYLFYSVWRHKGSGYGPEFAVWIISQTCASTYALAWDFLFDWSILNPHAKYPLLRKNLVYTNHIYLYYFAIVSNTLIRFIWIMYIPTPGLDSTLRTFIAALFEMLRRWQWNFYRVENEHLGNVDQYRITREVPLPYSLEYTREDDADDEDGSPSRSWFAQRAIRLRRQKPT